VINASTSFTNTSSGIINLSAGGSIYSYRAVNNTGTITTVETNIGVLIGILEANGTIEATAAQISVAAGTPLTIPTGTTLKLSGTTKLTVTGTLTVQASASITGAANTSKIEVQESGTITGAANFYYNDGTTAIGTTIPAGTYTWVADKWKSDVGAPIVVTNEDVYYYDESTPYPGNGTVKIGSLQVGTVTDGKLSFTLPSVVDITGATPVDWEEVEVTPPDPVVNVYIWELDFFRTGETEKIGQLLFTKTGEGGTHYITDAYFAQACEVTAIGNFTVSINANAGWNKLYQYGADLGGGTITTDVASAPTGLKWVFEESPVQVENEQVYNEDGSVYAGSNAEVKIRALPVGNVTNGKLSFTLPTTRETNALADALTGNTPINWAALGTGAIVVNPADAHMYGIQLDFIISPAKKISLGKTDGDDVYHEVQYFYIDKACTVSGTDTITDHDETFSATVSINAHHPGWNKVYQYGTESSMTFTTDLTNVPTGLKWMIGEQNSDDDDDDDDDDEEEEEED
jgi:hypothetical protein